MSAQAAEAARLPDSCQRWTPNHAAAGREHRLGLGAGPGLEEQLGSCLLASAARDRGDFRQRCSCLASLCTALSRLVPPSPLPTGDRFVQRAFSSSLLPSKCSAPSPSVPIHVT